MRKRNHEFIPSALGTSGSRLEERVVLSTLRARPTSVQAATRAAAHGDTGFEVVPFVRAGAGQRQNALNFTSRTYWQIVKGGPTDLEDIADDFKDAGEDFRNGVNNREVRNVLRQLERVAKKVPYGRQELLPIWLETLQDSVGLDEDTIESRLRRDLQVYINSGVGTDWNIIKTKNRSFSTDSDLIFTGSVIPVPVEPPVEPVVPTVTLSVAPSTLAEAGGTTTVTATLSAVSTRQVTVTLGVSGTATPGTDYTAPPTVGQPISPTPPPTIIIPAGSLTGTLVLTAVQDTVDEPDETIVVDIASVTNGTEVGAQQATATITDDDAAPTVTLGVAPTTLVEAGGTSTLTATLSALSALPVTVTLGLTGTATLGTDYTTPPAVSQPISPTPPPTIVIPAGSLTGTLVLTAVQDALDELDETVVADIAAVTNGTESGTQQATATITDDDPAPVV